MRRMILALLTNVVWLTAGGSAVLADGMVLPFPQVHSNGYVAVRYHHVEVRIEDGHAVTRVEQEFYNPYDYPVHGQYLFPIPPEAMLSRFQATVDGRAQEVARQDAAGTNATLFAIVAQQHDPSLLQYADWESLALDLDLPPGGSRKMSLEYEEILAPSGGLYRYRYVLGTERYSALPLEEVSVRVELKSAKGLASIYSPSHSVALERVDASRALVQWQASYVQPAEDFELYYSAAEGGFGGGLLTGQRDGSDHFLFLFSPETEQDQAAALPKDVVLVIDHSGSMSGEKMEQARGALNQILGQLGEGDRFSIIAFDEEVSILADSLLTVGERSMGDARRFVDSLAADGSTNLEAALNAGLETLARSETRNAPRLVVFLTDGLPTAGVTDETMIARLVSESNASLEARLHVFGVGYDVNTHLLDRLAAENGGTVTYVQPGENMETVLTEFYDKIARPVLTDVTVDFEGIDASEIYPQTLPDLFQGSSLVLAGRYRATDGQATVWVRGRAGDMRREYVYHFALAEPGDRDFVPRLWATRRIGALLDQVRVEGESKQLVDEIRELGLGYGLVTPYTTFVIEGQADGAASAENMALYGRSEVNQASGQTTIMARVQNQAYQQTDQAGLAVGANVQNMGARSMAQVEGQNVDLSLFQGQKALDAPITVAWVERNIVIDQTIIFGSEAYFALAADAEARPFLQGGPEVIFSHEGQVISVEEEPGTQDGGHNEPNAEATPGPDRAVSSQVQSDGPQTQPQPGRTARVVAALLNLLASLLP
jgi:Ca-activated chloride channel family protein